MGKSGFARWLVVVLAIASLGVIAVSVLKVDNKSSVQSPKVSDGVEVELSGLGKALQEMQNPGPDQPRAATSPKILSSLIPEDGASAVTPEQRRLLDSLPDPSIFVPSMRLGTYDVKDPNGNLKAGDRWYEPKVVQTDCNVKIDSSPVPVAHVTYVPGDAELKAPSQLASQMLVMQSQFSLAVELQLFDDRGRRDQMFKAMVDLLNGPLLENCKGVSALMGRAKTLSAPPLGKNRFAYSLDTMLGDQVGSLIAVGDRGILRLGTGSFGFEGAKGTDQNTTEALITATVKAVEASGIAN